MSLDERSLPQKRLTVEARLAALPPISDIPAGTSQQDEQQTFCMSEKPTETLTTQLIVCQTGIVPKIL